MAYSTPRTWVAGEVATAANFNTYLRDNIAWIATDSPAVQAYSSTTQSLANNGVAAVNMNSELFDNCSGHSTSSNTNRLTVPSGGAGKYLIAYQLTFTVSSTSAVAAVQLNTTTAFTGAITKFGAFTSIGGAIPWSLAAGDWITLVAENYAGATRNIGNNGEFEQAPSVGMFWFRT